MYDNERGRNDELERDLEQLRALKEEVEARVTGTQRMYDNERGRNDELERDLEQLRAFKEEVEAKRSDKVWVTLEAAFAEARQEDNKDQLSAVGAKILKLAEQRRLKEKRSAKNLFGKILPHYRKERRDRTERTFYFVRADHVRELRKLADDGEGLHQTITARIRMSM